MSNLIRTIFSAFAGKGQARDRGTQEALRYVTGVLPRHRVSLTATASFGFTGIPEEIRIRDINEKGLYFYTKLDMPVGATFDIVAVLPPDISANRQGRRVHYEAKVVRVERDRGKEHYGVGASIRRCETFPLPTTEPDTASKNVPSAQSLQPTETALEKTVQKTTASAAIEKASELEAVTPVEETIARSESGDSPTPDRKVTIQGRHRAIVEKLATTALRAGISLEELVQLIESGINPTELVDIIEARLMAHVQQK